MYGSFSLSFNALFLKLNASDQQINGEKELRHYSVSFEPGEFEILFQVYSRILKANLS